MRVLLVKPKPELGSILGLQGFFLLEPLELGTLAAAVPREHEVEVLDLRFERRPRRALERRLAALRPEVVGFTAYTHEASQVKAAAAAVRRALPGTYVVVGGHHATVAPEDFAVETVDAVVRGEGTGPFRSILDALERGERPEGIRHVLFPAGSWEGRGEWPRISDPATWPRPRRDLWDPHRYRAVWVTEDAAPWQPLFPPVAMVRSSYGCTMRCSFCVVPYLCGGVHAPRPVDAVVDEIAALTADHVYFCDDENFIDERFAWQLAEAIERRGVRKRYFAWARSTTVNRSPELFRKWRSVGLDAAFLGFEFPTDDGLRRTSKGGTVAGNERALATLRSLGVAVHAAFLLEPGYRDDEFGRLRSYVAAMPPAQCSFNVMTPSPGTPGWEEMAPRLWVDEPYDLYDCMHPLTPTALPLREFARRYAELVAAGTAKTPLRSERRPIRPGDAVRVLVADRRYASAYRRLYRDYPRRLWDASGPSA